MKEFSNRKQKKDFLKKVLYLVDKVGLEYDYAKNLDEDEIDCLIEILQETVQKRRNSVIDSFRVNPGLKAPIGKK